MEKLIFPSLLKEKRVAVLGMGESGISASRLLHGLGAKVLLSESKKKEEIKKKPKIPEGIEIEYGGHSKKVLSADAIVVSPGVSLDIPILKEAQNRKIPIIGELELAFLYIPVPVIAITGTNGKTTTTTLIGKILKADGRKVSVGGNIGKPLCSYIGQDGSWKGQDLVVCEVSSFQLETIQKFRPKVATILNISENHLDRYSKFEDYVKAKENILKNQLSEDFAVLNSDCPFASSLALKTRARIIWFSKKKEPAEGVFATRNGEIIAKISGKENFICNIKDIRLKGAQNLENVLAAIASTIIFNVRGESIVKVLKEFSGLEHRFEFFADLNGVRFVDDSKATNVDAVLKALGNISSPVILIAGGRYKGGDFGLLVEHASEKLKYVILLGEARDIIKRFLVERDSFFAKKIKEANSMGSAVKISFKLAKKGDYVLLSPGCSSFDMFKDYKERGRIFKEEAKKLNG